MEIVLLPQAKADRDYWKKTGNVAVMKRISALLADILLHPFEGIGKPKRIFYSVYIFYYDDNSGVANIMQSL